MATRRAATARSPTRRTGKTTDMSEERLNAPSVGRVAAAPSASPWPMLGVLLVIARVALSFYYQVITDCDQTFNYEEPTHYLLYGRGLQTWEYSPQYALRSYAYLAWHSFMGLITGAAWGADKIAVFHRIHALLAVLCALGEMYFITGIARSFGNRLAMLTYLCLLLSAGMAHAAPSYLPSTFTMVGLMFAWGAWLRISPDDSTGDNGARKRMVQLTVACAVLALALGWPFAVVAVVPMGLYLLWRPGPLALVPSAVLSLVVVCGACLAVDYHYYRRLLLAPLNIILYNAFGVGGGGHGADLYGVEPWSFYAHNLALNFNIQTAAAAVTPLMLALEVLVRWRQGQAEALARRKKADASEGSDSESNDGADDVGVGKNKGKRAAPSTSATSAAGSRAPVKAVRRPLASPKLVALLAQLYLWFFLMSGRPHKEERFMFVVFPLISVAAAVSLAIASDVVSGTLPLLSGGPVLSYSAAAALKTRNRRLSLGRALVLIFLLATAQLSLSRLVALARGYSAPMAAWTFVARETQDHVYSGGSDTAGNRELPASHRFYKAKRTESALEALFFHTKPALTATADVVSGITAKGAKKVVADAARKAGPAGAVVCVGKEWYRFPGSFFLPERARSHAAISLPSSPSPRQEHGPVKLLFLKSSFGGQLPQPFLPKHLNGTSALRPGFNDLNAEEAVNRYPEHSIALDCDYIVDSLLPTPRGSQGGSRYEPYFEAMAAPRSSGHGNKGSSGGAAQKPCTCMTAHDDKLVTTDPGSGVPAVEWESLWSAPFVHSDSSPRLSRALWIPRFSEARNSYAAYHVLKKQPCTCFQKAEEDNVKGEAQ